jgi:hypothetical protein
MRRAWGVVHYTCRTCVSQRFDFAIVTLLTLSYCICPAMHYQLCSSLMKGLSFRCCRVMHRPVTAMQC